MAVPYLYVLSAGFFVHSEAPAIRGAQRTCGYVSTAELTCNNAVGKKDKLYSIISVTTPDPTVLPPSRIANLSPSSIAISVIREIVMVMLSPAIHISTPSGN